jgi:type IV secretory pathway VirB10-like protein
MTAMLASALLGAAVYQTVLSKPAPPLDPTATVETITREPGPQPTLYRTEVRTVVEPTPTVTVEERIVLVDQPRTANPAPTRTSAPRPTPRATTERESDDSREGDEAQEHSEDEDSAQEAAEEAAKEAADEGADAAESESDD